MFNRYVLKIKTWTERALMDTWLSSYSFITLVRMLQCNEDEEASTFIDVRSRDLLKEHQVRPWRGGYSVNDQHVCHIVDHGRCVPEQDYLQYLQRTRASFTSLGFATLEPVQHSSYCHTQASRKLGIIWVALLLVCIKFLQSYWKPATSNPAK